MVGSRYLPHVMTPHAKLYVKDLGVMHFGLELELSFENPVNESLDTQRILILKLVLHCCFSSLARSRRVRAMMASSPASQDKVPMLKLEHTGLFSSLPDFLGTIAQQVRVDDGITIHLARVDHDGKMWGSLTKSDAKKISTLTIRIDQGKAKCTRQCSSSGGSLVSEVAPSSLHISLKPAPRALAGNTSTTPLRKFPWQTDCVRDVGPVCYNHFTDACLPWANTKTYRLVIPLK